MKSIKIFLIACVAFFFIIAIINNPSKNEAKKKVQTELIHKFINNSAEDKSEDSAELLTFLALLKTSEGEKIMDALINVEVTNYIIFSSFETRFAPLKDDVSLDGNIFMGKVFFSSKSVNKAKKILNESLDCQQ